MELYVERGYEQTTVADIAEQAGLTARTFFCYLTGKRAVAEPQASLAAEAGIAVLRVAFERWVSEPGEQDLATLMADSLQQLQRLTIDR